MDGDFGTVRVNALKTRVIATFTWLSGTEVPSEFFVPKIYFPETSTKVNLDAECFPAVWPGSNALLHMSRTK